jgi:hypothetical protein
VRKSLLFLLSVELLLAVAFGLMGHMDRPAMARAWLEWRQHPSDETHGAFERQKRIADIENWSLSAGVFVALAGVTVFVYWIRRGEPSAPGNSRQASQSSRL